MSGRPWTRAELAAVRRRYPNEPTAELAKSLGRSLSATYNMADKLGLTKSAKYLASPAACRLGLGDNPGWAHRFTPGHATWNKGKHHKPPGSERGWFKPGTLNGAAAQRMQPIGCEKIGSDGVLTRKVSNNRSRYARWKPVHRIVWEASNGPVPRGFIVVFRPGKKTAVAAEIAPDRLELISRAENMRRNSYLTRYPKEVADVIRLRGALRRKINNRMRKQA